MSRADTKATIFMTGASRGIGLALATKLLYDGHRVATFSRTLPPELKELGDTYASSCLIIRGDIADAGASANAVASAAAHFGGLDSVVLNSGLATTGTVRTGPLEDFKQCFDVNFFGAIPILQAALPTLDRSARGARVVLISKVGAVFAGVALAPYCTSKAAVNALARSLAIEEPNTITTVAVNPGLVETVMVQNMMAESVLSEDLLNDFKKGIAARDDPTVAENSRLVAITPEESGSRLAWLALNVPKEMSGRYLDVGDLRDPEIAALLRSAV